MSDTMLSCRLLLLNKKMSELTPPKKRLTKGLRRVRFSLSPKRKAVMKKSPSTSTESSPASPVSCLKRNMTATRKVKALKLDANLACVVQLEREFNPITRTQYSLPSKESERKTSDEDKIPVQKKRQRRRRCLTFLNAPTVCRKNPARTLSLHENYFQLLPGIIEKLKHETSCASRRVLVLEQLEDEVFKRYLKLRSLSTKNDENVTQRKNKIMTEMEGRISDLQQIIQTSKTGLNNERSTLFRSTGSRICCYFCNSLCRSK
ncbi:unnamed protein product [Orchesella dallaii]|uniref:Uncharacterized protein n=1 Tax=Orchesella dallaii TaxID=48710 RepID=A0ABP1QB43_9HEXA